MKYFDKIDEEDDNGCLSGKGYAAKMCGASLHFLSTLDQIFYIFDELRNKQIVISGFF